MDVPSPQDVANGVVRNSEGVIVGNVFGIRWCWCYIAIAGYHPDGKAITVESHMENDFDTAQEATEALLAMSARQGWPRMPEGA